MSKQDVYKVFDSVEANVSCADMYAVLALLVQFPTPELAQGLAGGALQADVAAIAGELGIDAQAVRDLVDAFDAACKGDAGASFAGEVADAGSLYEAMRRERTRLFDHPDQPAVRIYEAQFLYELARERGEEHKTGMLADMPQMFVNNAALDAERCYRAAGLVRDIQVNVPGDCMFTELEFMAHLHTCKARALNEGDAQAAAQVEAQIQEFARIHVARWFPAFFDALTLQAHGPYRLTGVLGALFMRAVLA